MTELDKPVTRKTKVIRQGRAIVVTLRADQQIEFRLLGKQEKFKVPIEELYTAAQRMSMDYGIHPRKK